MGNIQEAHSKATETLITESNLGAALEKAKGPGAKLVSWKIKDFTSKGDNYVGVVTSVEIKCTLDGVESSISFIAKLGPSETNKILRDGISHAFLKEARVYNELIPRLNAELDSVGQKELCLPSCFHATWESEKEVIYLQDLRSHGFKTYDRKKSLDLKHTVLTIKELARLHAASLLLQVKDDDLDVKYPFLNKDCFDVTEDVVKVSVSILNKYIDKAITILKEFDGYSIAVQWLKDLKTHAFKTMMKQLDSRTRFAVLCHGDCWNNNLLFRYDPKGNPTKVMLIDLQLVRRASLAVDLSMLFYLSLTGSDRKANIDIYLDAYYTSFRFIMEARGLVMPFTREELNDEYKSKRLYGFLWAIVCLPSILSDAEELSDESFSGNASTEGMPSSTGENVSQSCDGDSQRTEEKQKGSQNEGKRGSLPLVFQRNPEMTSRFLSLFDAIF